MSVTIQDILKATAFRPQDVAALLDPNHPSWIKFDPELGYVPADIVMRDGMDMSKTVYTHHPKWGNRRIINYAEKPCRINTYGDSFTQCQQVSDDETWQERLAAHLGEPIRSFGSGGYSVMAAWRRCLRMEATECAAENIFLNIFDDDHIRNLDASRWVRTHWDQRNQPPKRLYPLHGLPWAHLRYDLKQGCFVDREGLCKDEKELLALTDPEKFYETFKDDSIVHLFARKEGADVDVSEFEQIAEALNIKVDLRSPATLGRELERFHRAYGFRSTEHLMDNQILPWAKKNGKKVLILLSYSKGCVASYLRGDTRFDPMFIDYLQKRNIPYVDSLEKHKEDFQAFRITPDEYIDRYYIGAAVAAVFGHYTPIGNMFFAFAIKNEVVDFLDPKPMAYAEEQLLAGA